VHADYTIFTTDDAFDIVGRLFEPDGEMRGVVVIAPAMAVAQEYYAPIAGWLADRGFLVITFDYRGTGQSLRGPLRDFDADIFDWARRDCSAVLQRALDQAAGRPLFWIGHSVGGQIVPLVKGATSISKIITIAAGVGYWRTNPRPLRYYAILLWYLIVPIVLPLFGYFPGERLRILGDLPSGVMRQWRRWCLHPRYSVGVEGPVVEAEYAAIRAPLFSLSFSDDEFMSSRSIAVLNELYENAAVTVQTAGPEDLDGKHIGHFGFFRPGVAEPLWKKHLLVELTS